MLAISSRFNASPPQTQSLAAGKSAQVQVQRRFARCRTKPPRFLAHRCDEAAKPQRSCDRQPGTPLAISSIDLKSNKDRWTRTCHQTFFSNIALSRGKWLSAFSFLRTSLSAWRLTAFALTTG